MTIIRDRVSGFMADGMLEALGFPDSRESRRPPGRLAGLATVVVVKVLLVCDAAWVRNQVRAALSGSAEIVEVTDPRRAETVADSEDISAAIVDMQVGSMGGIAITRALKGVTPGVGHIVLLLDRRADKFIAKRAGSDAWLLKPFSAQELRAVLADVRPIGAQR